MGKSLIYFVWESGAHAVVGLAVCEGEWAGVGFAAWGFGAPLKERQRKLAVGTRPVGWMSQEDVCCCLATAVNPNPHRGGAGRWAPRTPAVSISSSQVGFLFGEWLALS